LNEAQRRHVVASFAHVDRLLQDIEHLAQPDASPFASERPDLSPDESRLLLSFVRLARGQLLAALDRLGLPRPVPTVSARWSIETALRFAEIALSELQPKTLAAYGALDAEAAADAEALAAELRRIMRRGVALLRDLEPEQLAERLAGVRGRAGAVLRSLERLSTEHGLAALRPLIAAAAGRAQATTLDIAVFGRVGAGKSSLINALVGLPALPVGATPVTAVPVLLGCGPTGATVSLYEGGTRSISIEDLATYVTEQHNPQNRRGVRSVEISVPSAPAGLRLVDTPGVGSLAASGPAQAFAWLPRCDLGLVLVQAGSPVGREELALVTGLLGAGIACRILVSKSDLLAPAEAESAAAYVTREFDDLNAGVRPTDVGVVSTRPEHRAQLEAFRRDVLAPLARDHARSAREALRARLHQLVTLTAAAMDGHGSSDAGALPLARTRLAGTHAVEQEVKRLARASPRILDEAAQALADAWSHGDDGALSVRNTILGAAAAALGTVSAAIDAVRMEPQGSHPGGGRRLPPLFDPEFLDHLPSVSPPRIGRGWRGRTVAARRLQSLAVPLTVALERFGERLRAWGLARLDEAAAVPGDAVPVSPPVLRGELAAVDALIDLPDDEV
jgi:hypothetical protein